MQWTFFKKKMIIMNFNVSIGDSNGNLIYQKILKIEDIKDEFPEVIKNEGEFWKGEFWRNYNFLFCLSSDKVYFIYGNKFEWEKVISKYPNIWDNKFLINHYTTYNRDKKIEGLLKK